MPGDDPVTRQWRAIEKMRHTLVPPSILEELKRAMDQSEALSSSFSADHLQNLIPHYEPPALDMGMLESFWNDQREAAEAPTARRAVVHVMAEIRAFEATLDQDSEVGVKLVPFGSNSVIHISEVGFRQPNLVVLVGTLSSGEPVTLIQHLSQLNFLLLKAPRLHPEEPRKPIGFRLVADNAPPAEEPAS